MDGSNINDGNWLFSPDSRFLLSSTFRSDVVRLLDANNLELIREFDTRANRPRDIAWNRDGTKFASTHFDEIQVWDVETGQRIAQRFDYIENTWNADLTWSPDGHAIAFSGNVFGLRHTYNQGNLRVWDVAEQQPILSIPDHAEFLRDVVWSRDGSQILTSSPYSTKLWDARTGELRHTFLENENAPANLSTDWNSVTNQIAMLQSKDQGHRVISIVDAETGDLLRELNVAESTQEILWRPQSTMLLTVRQEAWTIWDADTGDILFQTLHEGGFRPLVSWSPDGNLIATLDQQIAVWEIAEDGTRADVLWELSLDAEGITTALTWHPDGALLAVGKNQDVLILDAHTGDLITQFETPINPHVSSHRVNSLAWSPDGAQIASFTEFEPYLYLWQVAHISY